MKRWITLFLLVVLCMGCAAQSRRELFTAYWSTGLRYGVELLPDTGPGTRWDVGATLMGTLDADLWYVVPMTAADSDWQVLALGGVLNLSAPLSLTAGMVAFGGACVFRRHLADGQSVDIKLGAGVPFFFETDSAILRDTRFLFGLWPDLSVSYTRPL